MQTHIEAWRDAQSLSGVVFFISAMIAEVLSTGLDATGRYSHNLNFDDIDNASGFPTHIHVLGNATFQLINGPWRFPENWWIEGSLTIQNCLGFSVLPQQISLEGNLIITDCDRTVWCEAPLWLQTLGARADHHVRVLDMRGLTLRSQNFETLRARQQSMEGRLSVLLRYPELSEDNDTDESDLESDASGAASPEHAMNIEVDRSQSMLTQARTAYAELGPHAFREIPRVRFTGEMGVDEGGLRKEFVTLVLRELLAPSAGLFVPEGAPPVFELAEIADPAHAAQLQDLIAFCGRMVGLAIRLDVPVPGVFSGGILWAANQLQAPDEAWADVFTHMPHGIPLLRMFWNEVRNVVGEQDEEDVHRIPYSTLSALADFSDCISGTQNAFATPAEAVRVWREQTRYVVGASNVLFDALLPEQHPCIEAFWAALGTFSSEDLKRLFTFVTNFETLPRGGFADLAPRFSLKAVPREDIYPVSHTCTNQLDIPSVTDPETMRARLMYTLDNVGVGYGAM